MNEKDDPAGRFEPHRDHLRAVAFRILGSTSNADDAVQETWLRYSRADSSDVRNLKAWLTTIVSRVCFNMLRARRSGVDETPLAELAEQLAGGTAVAEPEDEAMLIDSVGRALLVVLDRLGPAERLAFVLHDMFAVPFDDIAAVVDRTPGTAKKLASRARQRVRSGGTTTRPAELRRQWQVASAFLAASRRGDIDALIAVLDPNVVRRADPVILPTSIPTELHGAQALAEESAANPGRAQTADLALIDGSVGILVAPRGTLTAVLQLTIKGTRISAMDVVTDPPRLARLHLAAPAGDITGQAGAGGTVRQPLSGS